MRRPVFLGSVLLALSLGAASAETEVRSSRPEPYNNWGPHVPDLDLISKLDRSGFLDGVTVAYETNRDPRGLQSLIANHPTYKASILTEIREECEDPTLSGICLRVMVSSPADDWTWNWEERQAVIRNLPIPFFHADTDDPQPWQIGSGTITSRDARNGSLRFQDPSGLPRIDLIPK